MLPLSDGLTVRLDNIVKYLVWMCVMIMWVDYGFDLVQLDHSQFFLGRYVVCPLSSIYLLGSGFFVCLPKLMKAVNLLDSKLIL